MRNKAKKADPKLAQRIAQSNPCALQASLQTVTTCLNWRGEMNWARQGENLPRTLHF